MSVNIKFRNTLSNQDTIEYVNQRLSSRLDRFAQFFESVSVTLSDVNGPKGGVDQQCLLVIKIEGIPKIVIQEAQTSQQSAIDRAFARAHMAVARQMKRKTQLEKNRSVKAFTTSKQYVSTGRSRIRLPTHRLLSPVSLVAGSFSM